VRRGNEIIKLRSKDAMDLQRGDIVTLSVGGGGGYGPPAERTSERIAADLEDGIISDAAARSWTTSEGTLAPP
jgi:N-methylhydantoinase B